jgi:hypothetical protein
MVRPHGALTKQRIRSGFFDTTLRLPERLLDGRD